MSHDFHPNATRAGLLSPYCEDCCSKLLGGLDDGYFRNVAHITRAELAQLPGWLLEAALNTNAMRIQRWTLNKSEEGEALTRLLEKDNPDVLAEEQS